LRNLELEGLINLGIKKKIKEVEIEGIPNLNKNMEKSEERLTSPSCNKHLSFSHASRNEEGWYFVDNKDIM
jgi:hypothetical protein